eukprot:TRINITY_DN6333_c0_g1_i1.p1 TRINITY_DN6333_c0_g1~~TRINITY_DN6333_c0_g1_i1.p1  ORF type:complete len:233 (-),score=31.34 TRINITY_DN6333_c0_g1_i1:379-1014(-)
MIPDDALVPDLRVKRGSTEGVVVQGFGDRIGDGYAIVRWPGRKETVPVKDLEVAGTVQEALEKGTKEERVLVPRALLAELRGSRFKNVKVEYIKAGVYRLDGHQVAVQWASGQVLVHGSFDEHGLLHPTRCAVKAFLEDHCGSQVAADAECDLFGSLAGNKDQGRARSRSPRHSGNVSLPAGWTHRESRSKPGVFYYAHESGKTQFERPTR